MLMDSHGLSYFGSFYIGLRNKIQQSASKPKSTKNEEEKFSLIISHLFYRTLISDNRDTRKMVISQRVVQ